MPTYRVSRLGVVIAAVLVAALGFFAVTQPEDEAPPTGADTVIDQGPGSP